MIRNYFNPQTHVGEQPVRVLKWNIADQMEKVHSGFFPEYQKILATHGLNPCITYDYSKKPLISITFPYSDPIPDVEEMIPHVNAEKEIVVQEVFLCYLWILCYCQLVQFCEGLEKDYQRQIGKDLKTDVAKLQEVERFYDYAQSLISRYSDWKIPGFPNPELSDDQNQYIGLTNGLFVHAMSFVLLHELGHIKLGHIAPTKRNDPNDVRIKDEKRADSYAIRTILKGVASKEDKFNRGIGMIVGLGALLNLKADPVNPQHPDSDDRLETLLRKLKLTKIDREWGFAWGSFRLWAHGHHKNFATPGAVGDLKELFYSAYNQSRQAKVAGCS